MYRPEEGLGTSLNHLIIEVGLGTDLIRHFNSLPQVHFSEAQYLSIALWFRLVYEGKTAKPLAIPRKGPTITVGVPMNLNKFIWLYDFVKAGTVVSTSVDRHAEYGRGENWHLLDAQGVKWRKQNQLVQLWHYPNLDHVLLLGVDN
ncbi:hypothetical protein KWAN_72 [Erwinia phage vB_EamM_Kwan]|uniref:Uncharacterized protein n=1 Tax=Erwinia phage vB_EamM_Kwan TaxID=1883374 RepID=A0A1B2IDY1_9CAUD|nr:hypothetical protein BIZ80_gp227 [Erwinia phage vB_EamM_Kwan]ANZ49424.1 hypothetical protein KWAN_72 [Erwinia phage vB_EamM_Kwan]